jgi:hypothetical protein
MQLRDKPNDLSADLQHTSPNGNVVPNIDGAKFYSHSTASHHPFIPNVRNFLPWPCPVHSPRWPSNSPHKFPDVCEKQHPFDVNQFGEQAAFQTQK